MHRRYIEILFFCLSQLFILNNLNAEVPDVQIRIGKGLSKILIEGRNLQQNVVGSVQAKNFEGKKSLLFSCDSIQLKQAAVAKRSTNYVSKVSSSVGIVKWNQTPYRGELIVTTNDSSNRCDLINKLPMENYISSLLAKEMNANWPLEALKAQAVAARTYAYQRIQSKNSLPLDQDSNFDLENSEKDQVGGGFFDETQVTNEAALATKGEILTTRRGKLTPIFYHAKCGGRTFRPDSIWESQVSGYESVECPYCYKYGQKDWTLALSRNEFYRLLKKVKSANVSQVPTVYVAKDHVDRTHLRVYLGEHPTLIKKPTLRNLLGRKKLPSNNFKVSIENGQIVFTGRGYGHGVGMCQLGALEMARQGMDYKAILAHYFPQHRLKKIY